MTQECQERHLVIESAGVEGQINPFIWTVYFRYFLSQVSRAKVDWSGWRLAGRVGSWHVIKALITPLVIHLTAITRDIYPAICNLYLNCLSLHTKYKLLCFDTGINRNPVPTCRTARSCPLSECSVCKHGLLSSWYRFSLNQSSATPPKNHCYRTPQPRTTTQATN
jgi:hypothetical protein